jgi:hypothetical protein
MIKVIKLTALDGYIAILKDHEWSYFKQQSFAITRKEALHILEELKDGPDFSLDTNEDPTNRYDIRLGPFDGKMKMIDGRAHYRVINSFRRLIMQQSLIGIDNYEMSDTTCEVAADEWDFAPFISKRQSTMI